MTSSSGKVNRGVRTLRLTVAGEHSCAHACAHRCTHSFALRDASSENGLESLVVIGFSHAVTQSGRAVGYR